MPAQPPARSQTKSGTLAQSHAQQRADDAYILSFTKASAGTKVAKFLAGEYTAHGHHESRTVYKKRKVEGDKSEVFCYFWDDQVSPGWCIGPRVDPVKVWAKCDSRDSVVPKNGWKLPADGPICKSMTFLSKQFVAAHMKARQEEQRQKEIVQQADRIIQQKQERLESSQLGDTKAMIETIEKKVQTVEDLVDKAEILHGEASEGWELDREFVESKLVDTEGAVEEAEEAFSQAESDIEHETLKLRRLESLARDHGLAELARLKAQLHASRRKLTQLKGLRKEVEAKQAAKTLAEELQEQLTNGELTLDEASRLILTLSDEAPTNEDLVSAEEALKKALDDLDALKNRLESFNNDSRPIIKEKVPLMQDRLKSTERKLPDLKKCLTEGVKRREMQDILQDAEEKMQDVFDKVEKVSDVDAEVSSESTSSQILEAVEKSGAARTAAHATLVTARTFVSSKYLEISRFPEIVNHNAKESLQAFKEQLATAAQKLEGIKLANLERKHRVLLKQAMEALEKAETLVDEVVAAAKPLADDSLLLDMPADEISKACDSTGQAEGRADDALAEAQKLITALQIEARGKDTPADIKSQLAALNPRVQEACKRVSDNKKLAKTVNGRLATQHLLKTARGKVDATDELVKLALEAISKLETPKPKVVDQKKTTAEKEVGELETGAEARAEESEEIQPEGEKDVATEAGDEEVSEETRVKTLAEALKTSEKVMAEAQLAVQTTDIFLETKVRATGIVNDQLKELIPRNKKLAEKLSSARSVLKVRSETISIETMFFEARARMADTEDAMAKAAQAEAIFLQGLEEPPTEASRSIWTDLESAVQAAQDNVGSTKTFLAMKRIAARQLSSERAAQSSKELAEIQSQLDTASKQLHQLLAKVPERRAAAVKHEISSYMQSAKTNLEKAQEGSQLLAKSADDAKLSPDEMKEVCAQADQAQRAAKSAVASARKLLEKRRKESLIERHKKESDDGEGGSPAVDMEEFIAEVASMEKVLADLKAAATQSEHQFVAKRLANEATQVVEEAEKKLSTAAESAAPLVSDETQELAHCITLTYIIEALKAHFLKVSKDAKEVFRDMAGAADSDGEVVKQSQFVSFLRQLSKEDDSSFPQYSEDELRTIYDYMDIDRTGVLSEAKFLDHFRNSYMCVSPVSITSGLDVKGGKPKRKLAVDEIFVASSGPQKDGSLSIMRVLGTAEKDGLEGWVTVAGNGGTVFLSKYSQFDACLKKVESALREARDVSSQVSVHLKSKLTDLSGVRSGPLADAKAEITRLQARLHKLDGKHQELRKQVAAGKAKHQGYIDKEKMRQQQVAERKSALLITAESTKLVTEAEEAAAPAVVAAEALLRSGAETASPDPAKAAQEASKSMTETLQTVARAAAAFQAKAETTRRAATGPLAEARGEMVKIKNRLGTLETKCKRLQSSLNDMHMTLVQDAQEAIRTALLRHIEDTNTTASLLYKNLRSEDAVGATLVPVSRLRELLQKVPGCSQLPSHQLDLGLSQFGQGISRFGLLASLSQYRQCTREVGLLRSSAPARGDDEPPEGGAAVAAEKPIRLLKMGELLQVTGATDDFGRIPCRTLLDSKQGFIPVSNEDDEEVSKVIAKPYYCFSAALPFQRGLSSSTETIRKLRIGEVLEVLQGPRKEPQLEFVRARCKAIKDGASGFLTMKSKSGEANLKPCELLVCVVSIAITTELDVAEGKSLRKLAVGEVLEVVDGISQDTERNLSRAHTRALNDGVEGWVTLKGAQGTSYVEKSSRHYTCACSLALEEQLANGSDAVRTLEQGELVEVLEGPLKFSKPGSIRMKGRAILDDEEGWVTVPKLSSQRWSPNMRVAQATSIDDGPMITSCKRIRLLDVGELVEAIEPPILEEKAKVMRVMARAPKDGVIGHITMKGNKGTVFLEIAP